MSEPALQILSGCDHPSFDIYPIKSPETESPESVPVFGFGEERLDPDLAFAHRFGIRGRGVIAPNALAVFYIKRTVRLPLLGARRAALPDYAGLTGSGWGLVDIGSRDEHGAKHGRIVGAV